MNYTIKLTASFRRSAKRLMKKYPSLPKDLSDLQSQLLKNPRLGTSLGENTYKIRLLIRSKKRGKSGGGRVITYVYTTSTEPEESGEIILLQLYDKSDRESIFEEEIKVLIAQFLEEEQKKREADEEST